MTDQELNEAVTKKLDALKSNIHEGKAVVLRGGVMKFPHPNYATDIGAAWGILEYLQSKNQLWIFEIRAYDEKFKSGKIYRTRYYNNCQYNDPFYKEYAASADTAPRAICEAFLKMP